MVQTSTIIAAGLVNDLTDTFIHLEKFSSTAHFGDGLTRLVVVCLGRHEFGGLRSRLGCNRLGVGVQEVVSNSSGRNRSKTSIKAKVFLWGWRRGLGGETPERGCPELGTDSPGRS